MLFIALGYSEVKIDVFGWNRASFLNNTKYVALVNSLLLNCIVTIAFIMHQVWLSAYDSTISPQVPAPKLELTSWYLDELGGSGGRCLG